MAGQTLTENMYSSGLAYENPANSKRAKRSHQAPRTTWCLVAYFTELTAYIESDVRVLDEWRIGENMERS